MLKSFPLVYKIVVALLSLSLVPVLVIGVSYYQLTKDELQKRTILALRAVTKSRAAHINHSIKLRQEQAKELAGSSLLRQLKESGVNEPGLVEQIQQNIDSTFYCLTLPSAERYRDIDKKTDIRNIGVWDIHGNIIANTDRNLIGEKMPADYMQFVYKYGTYFGGLEKDPLTGDKDMVLLEKIRNWQSGTIVGAVSLRVEANILDEIAGSREGLGRSGETYVVDKQYRMITKSRFLKDSILNVRVNTEGTRACFQSQPSPALYTNDRGVTVLGVQEYLPDEEWCLVAEIDADEAFSAVQSFRTRLLVVGGLLMALIGVLAAWASRVLAQPILALYKASQRVARGDYAVRLPVRSQDELGQLTTAFNHMAKRLADVNAELEEKNKTLFKHLAISASQKKELREVNEELDRFVYTASHDLRAPLRGIASFATFLEEDYKERLDEQGREYIDEIRKGATKMNALIEDLLLLSRISRIRNPYEMVDMNKLLSEVLERIKFDIQQNQAEILVRDAFPVVCCDRIKMTEVLQNLVNNAIKFSSKNPLHPKVEIGYSKDGCFHRFTVKDNGIGIDPKYHDQIFGIFKRLHSDKEYEGTGAGLTIIKRIVDDHGGRIWVESKPGEGAVFLFTIPDNLKVGQLNPSGEESGAAARRDEEV